MQARRACLLSDGADDVGAKALAIGSDVDQSVQDVEPLRPGQPFVADSLCTKVARLNHWLRHVNDTGDS